MEREGGSAGRNAGALTLYCSQPTSNVWLVTTVPSYQQPPAAPTSFIFVRLTTTTYLRIRDIHGEAEMEKANGRHRTRQAAGTRSGLDDEGRVRDKHDNDAQHASRVSRRVYTLCPREATRNSTQVLIMTI